MDLLTFCIYSSENICYMMTSSQKRPLARGSRVVWEQQTNPQSRRPALTSHPSLGFPLEPQRSSRGPSVPAPRRRPRSFPGTSRRKGLGAPHGSQEGSSTSVPS